MSVGDKLYIGNAEGEIHIISTPGGLVQLRGEYSSPIEDFTRVVDSPAWYQRRWLSSPKTTYRRRRSELDTEVLLGICSR